MIMKSSFIKKVVKDPMYLVRFIKYRLALNTTEERELQTYASLLLGYDVDLKNPRTFNEKLTWLKLFGRNELYHKMVDKYEVKSIVANAIGEDYVVPCYGVWENFDDIDFTKLPNQFVVKSTHYGAPVVVKDKSKLDIDKLRDIIIAQSTESGYKANFEWVYKDVKPRIIVDKYLDDHSCNNVLQDYKFWCFNGTPRVMYLTVKDTDVYENFYDMDFNILNINHGFPRRIPEFSRPENFEKMKVLAAKLSAGTPFVRVDFYSVNGHIYFGEFTFYDWGGVHPFINKQQDLEIGKMLELPRYE